MLCSVCATFRLSFDGPATRCIPPRCVGTLEKYLWNVALLIYNKLIVTSPVGQVIQDNRVTNVQMHMEAHLMNV